MRICRRRGAARVWLLVALASACYPARGGFWPSIDRLAELQPGISTKADVDALLGAPIGRGAARFTAEMTRREVWVYGYLDFDGRSFSVDGGRLQVFFDGDRYDGHFWYTKGKPRAPDWRADQP